MKKQKTLSMTVLAVMIVISLLAGCSGTQSQSTTAAQNGVTTAAETTAEALPFVTVKYFDVGGEMPDDGRIYGIINEKLKKDLNCELVHTTVSWSDWATKYPLAFASGEDFDFSFSAYWANYADMVAKGSFAELTEEALQKYMPKTYAAVTKEQWGQTKVNGKIYMIPSSAPNYSQNAKMTFLVRGDLMKKYGINAIKTPQDMLAYWDAVTRDTASSGLIPMAVGGLDMGSWAENVASMFTKENDIGHTDNNHYDISHITTYFQVVDFTDPQNVKVVDNTAYNFERYKLLREFNKKGYFGKDAAVQTDESVTMFLNGKSATAARQIGNINGLYEQVMQAHPEFEPQIADIRPDLPVWREVVTSNGISLHATAKNPERAMMVLDLLGYDPSYHNLTNGVEGTDYSVNSDGSIHWITDSNGQKVFKGVAGYMGLSNLNYLSESRAPNYDSLMEEYDKNNITPALATMNFDASKLNSQIAAVSAVESKYLTILRLGLMDDIEGTYEKMQAELKTAGLEDIQAEYLKQAQAFMSTFGK